MKQLVILLLISSSVLGQQHLSLNLGGAAALNFNHSSRALEQPFEVETINGVINQSLNLTHSYNDIQQKHYLVFEDNNEVKSAYPFIVR